MPKGKSPEYRAGELELILSLAPTSENIKRLGLVLGRSEEALRLVYRRAFSHTDFPEGAALGRKVVAAKRHLGISLGRMTPRE